MNWVVANPHNEQRTIGIERNRRDQSMIFGCYIQKPGPVCYFGNGTPFFGNVPFPIYSAASNPFLYIYFVALTLRRRLSPGFSLLSPFTQSFNRPDNGPDDDTTASAHHQIEQNGCRGMFYTKLIDWVLYSMAHTHTQTHSSDIYFFLISSSRVLVCIAKTNNNK